MSDLIRGSIYSGDPEFDGLQLRHVRTTEREIKGVTLDGWAVTVRTTRQVFDFARVRDRAPADPNAAIRYEGPAEIGFKGYPAGKTVELIAAVRELLAVRPMLCHEIATRLGCTTTRIQKLFINQPDGFRKVARGPRGNLWGLA